MGTKPIIELDGSEIIRPRREISIPQVLGWEYGKEFSGKHLVNLNPHQRLSIVDMDKRSRNVWVKLLLAGTDPGVTIKLSGQEFAWNFDIV